MAAWMSCQSADSLRDSFDKILQFFISSTQVIIGKLNNSKTARLLCGIWGAAFPHLASHPTRVFAWMEFVSPRSTVWQTDRWTGRLTDNGDVNVAGNTPSEAPLWLLSQPLVLVPIKRGSFNFPPSFPAMTETVAPAQETLTSENLHTTTRGREISLYFL